MLFFSRKKPVIAVDGTAASGKGTLARRLAADLGMAYLDTGALYRYVAVNVMQQKINWKDEAAVTALAQKLAQTVKPSHLADPAIRSDEAGKGASLVSAYPGVRKALFELQQRFAKKPPPLSGGILANGAVLDGRDIGTVIAPDAPVKLFVTARPEVRARRRWKELRGTGSDVSFETVLADMQARDKRDANRKDAPMKPAKDAIILDTSDMTIEQVLDFAMATVRKRLRLR
jgi:cytidylate kinase